MSEAKPLVIIESPFAAPTPYGVDQNVEYAKSCMRDSFARGEFPFASHLLYTQLGILDDFDPEQRKLGMAAGFAWGVAASFVAVYVDKGVSRGMRLGVRVYNAMGARFEVRKLHGIVLPADIADAIDGSLRSPGSAPPPPPPAVP